MNIKMKYREYELRVNEYTWLTNSRIMIKRATGSEKEISEQWTVNLWNYMMTTPDIKLPSREQPFERTDPPG